ncbi:MAG: twin-arginine translocase subunit TatB, partial [Gemmobacter sp.]|nr:twin-arginine translocase subunit TatB [Gemmobacter sp.]
KDLPRMFHTLGRFTGKLRSMAREFQKAMNDAAKTAGLDEMRRDMNDIMSKKGMGLDALDRAATKFENWDPKKPAAKPSAPSASATAAPGSETAALAARKAEERAAREAKAATAAEIAADADMEADLAESPTEPEAEAAPAPEPTPPRD